MRLLPLLALLLLAGCLPSSQKELPRSLTPGDSLSRRIADTTAVDPLTLLSRTEPPARIGYPTGIQYRAGGGLVVADSKAGVLRSIGADGAWGEVWASGFSYPFLAGGVGDTVAVLNRDRQRLDLVAGGAEGGETVARIPTPEGTYANALVSARGVWFKAGGDGEQPFLARLSRAGEVLSQRDLPGPWWRHLGFLRAWGDTTLSLSGYRPVVDVLAGGRLDTLALRGFDSPLLVRSNQFLHGDLDEPPLLAPSAVALGDRLFVLNARLGWVRIDVYGRDGRLVRILEVPDPQRDDQFFPVDLAARRDSTGGVELAVLTLEPEPALYRYRWGG